jgi:hypothetical protein
MKAKLSTIIILAGFYCTSILTSCNQNNPQPNTNTNTANTAWKFKVTINGVTHRAEGNGHNFNTNYCFESSTYPGQNLLIQAGIIDKTVASYISGDFGGFSITTLTTPPQLGINSLYNCLVSLSWLTDISENIYLYGYSLTLNGPQVSGTAGGSAIGLPINLTSLGSTGVGLFKDPVKGNYSGTIYYRSTVGSNVYDTPISIDLEFEAMRL